MPAAAVMYDKIPLEGKNIVCIIILFFRVTKLLLKKVLLLK